MKNIIRTVSLLLGVVKYNKRGNKNGILRINGEGKRIKELFFCFVGGFRIWKGGLAGGGGLSTFCKDTFFALGAFV